MAASPQADPLPQARQALERGEYGLVLRLLEPVAEQHGPATPLGAGVRLLMATALMGQGQSERAAACCRALQASPDAALRTRARELLEILEAPQLRRPRDWSLTLPDLSGDRGFEAVAPTALSRRRAPGPPPPPPAPVGTTRPPLGFAALVALLLGLLLLASLLGGCMEVRTDLRFEGPGRLQVSHAFRHAGGAVPPLERRLTDALVRRGFAPVGSGVSSIVRTPVLPVARGLEALSASLEEAAGLAGIALPPPRLVFSERNWLVGVRQHFGVAIDLQDVPDLPGLTLEWRLSPLTTAAVRRADPQPVRNLPRPPGDREGPAVVWPLTPARINQLELSVWRWSPLGLGGLAIALALALVLGLQRLRLRLGFGLPELPA